MAENKKGFILYCDLIHTIEQLPNDKAGELFKHILRYVNDLNPITDDLVTKITFEPIRQQLKRDLTKWTEKSIKRSEAGRLGGLKSGEVRKQNEANEAIASNSKQNEQVIDKDTVTDIVIVKDIINHTDLLITWKNSFEKYIEDLNIAVNTLLQDVEWLAEREKFHPNLDIKLSMEKAYKDFWGTEAGWKHKKIKKSNDINWKSTFNSAIELNKVYKQR